MADAWVFYFPFTAHTLFSVDGPFGYDGSGRVLENWDSTLRLRIDIPKWGPAPEFKAEISVTYRQEGPGNAVSVRQDDGTQNRDDNAAITSDEGNRSRTIISHSGNLVLSRLSDDELKLAITTGGRTFDFRLRRKRRPVEQYGEISTMAASLLSASAGTETVESAKIWFHTTDEDKDGDTYVTAKVLDRNGEVVASIGNTFGSFDDNSDSDRYAMTVDSTKTRASLQGGSYSIGIDPHGGLGHDTWRFNFTIEIVFSGDSSVKPNKMLLEQASVELSQNSKRRTYDIP